VRTILWDRDTDKFTPGQWFKGKIYPDRSDLSPDGRYLIYFAMGGVAWAIPKTGGTWTAISRVPSLTALALWPEGGDTRDGGGLFASNNSYWLDPYHEQALRDDTNLKRVFIRPAPSRMERDGWVRRETGRKTKAFFSYEKHLPEGWTLRLRQNFLNHQYELEQPEHGVILEFPPWEWADWDRRRLAWAEQGCLRAATLEARNLGVIKTLYDFNGIIPTKSE
jgi:hypothetical protein